MGTKRQSTFRPCQQRGQEERGGSLTKHVDFVAFLTLEQLVDPHVLIRVEGANKHLIRLLGILNIVAEASFDLLSRSFAIVLVADI